MNGSKSIVTPTIIINEKQAHANIEKMVSKANAQSIRFRPHFKTHQSAEIGDWFRESHVEEIAVSSVKMANYFADIGWRDITIAFPINLRQLEEIKILSKRVKLGLLVDHIETANALIVEEDITADIWIKTDTGMGRAGINWKDSAKQTEIARMLIDSTKLKFKGLLTHAGQTYHAASPQEIVNLYHESVERINLCRETLEDVLNIPLEVSVGDTPGCWLCDDLGAVDEVRPGNYVFFDAMMHALGVCASEEISLCVACPVVSKYDDRREVLILGGSVHLSKEVIEHSAPPCYGYAVMSPDNQQWKIKYSNFVRSLSQEHGIVRLDQETFEKVQIGDLLYIIPVHSCLVVSALGCYQTTDGKKIKAQISL